ncbi:MAG: toxin-antitoxin system YwqK family antitoxin [Deltaproteobacteria bacterium]|nr:toxin-antitoxin system YwqK family antitoxin [Deltaproteobacteria bacterium]
MFQAFVFPKHVDGRIAPRKDFSGLWIMWNEIGGKVAEQDYKSGLLDGKETVWLSNQTKYEKHYKKGELDGAETYWDANGLVSTVNNFKNGKLHGTRTTYFKNGNKEVEENYVDGKRDGKTTSWYENGQIKAEELFKNRYRYGLWTYWKEDGTKESETNWTARFDKGERAFAGPLDEDEIDAALQSRPNRQEDELPALVIGVHLFWRRYPEFKALENIRNNSLVKLIKNMEKAGVRLAFTHLPFVVQNEIAGAFVGFSKTQTKSLEYSDIPYESILFVTTPVASYGNRVLVILGSVSPQQSTIFSVDGQLDVTPLYSSQTPIKYSDGNATNLGAISGIRVVESGLFQLAERWNHHGGLPPTIERQFLVDVRRGKFEISAMPNPTEQIGNSKRQSR